MKVVHFNNTGIVASSIAQFLNNIEKGTSIVYSVLPKGLEYIYEGLPIIQLNNSTFENDFFQIITAMSTIYELPDIIHVHGHPQWSFVNLMQPLREKGVKFVYTGHGTDVRFHWHDSIFFGYDARTYVTRDLEHPQAQYIPNAPNIHWFKREKNYTPNTALRKEVLRKHRLDNEWNLYETNRIAIKMGLTLFTQDYIEKPYIEYARYLEKFEYYFDFKYLLPSWQHKLALAPEYLPFSLTALEMLELGGKVFHGNKIYEELPDEHNYDKVMKQYLKLYGELLK